MKKSGEILREIKFFSKKNQTLVRVNTQEARAYSKYLEEMSAVKKYEANKPLIQERVRQLKTVDIRRAYLELPWESDFYLTYEDGTNGVREIVKIEELSKRAVVEKLELSRRYWKSVGVTDWKVISIGG